MLRFLAYALVVSTQAQPTQQQNRQISRLGKERATTGDGKRYTEMKHSPDEEATPATTYNTDSGSGSGDPQPLKQNSVSAGLFKNGYAFYVRQCEVSADGTYLLDLPSTVHGTLSVSSPDKDVSISTQYERVNVEGPLDASLLSKSKLQTAFAGKQVTLQLKDSTVTGTLAKLAEPDQALSSSSSSSSILSEASYNSIYSGADSADFLVLDDGQGGLTLVDPSTVLSFKIQGGAKPMRETTQLTLNVKGVKTSSPIQVSYLSYGLTWAPSYSLNLTSSSQLSIDFQAQIRNQGKALDASDVQLITGFPNLEFQSVTSLLSSDLNTFVREVQSAGQGNSQGGGSSIMSQSVMSNSAYGMAQNVQTTKVDADGSDVLYQSIGPLNLKAKSAVLKNIASATVPYQAVVDWDASEDDAWDAVRFLNPLSSAITTAPASVIQGTRLLGQSTTKWTPPKGLAIVHTSKALSVRVWKSETSGDDQPLQPARAKLVQVNVEGVLNVLNTRSTNVTMCVNYGFDGVLAPVRGANSPKVASTTDGSSGGLNPHTNVNWEFFMAAGAQANVTFYYSYKKRVYY